MPATRPEHREHAGVRVVDAASSLAHDFRQLAVMSLRHVDLDQPLVDPLVAEPRLQPPRVYAEQGGVGSEGVAQGMEQPGG